MTDEWQPHIDAINDFVQIVDEVVRISRMRLTHKEAMDQVRDEMNKAAADARTPTANEKPTTKG